MLKGDLGSCGVYRVNIKYLCRVMADQYTVKAMWNGWRHKRESEHFDDCTMLKKRQLTLISPTDDDGQLS